MAGSVTNLSSLFTTGYLLDGAGQKLKGRSKVSKVECFDAMVRRMNLQVYDIRINPWSQALAWRRDQIKARLGVRYLHLPALGNRNYKSGGAVDLVNAKAGKDMLLAAYNTNKRRPLILCGCEDVYCCHREEVARLFADHFGQWIELEHWFDPKEIDITDREHLGKLMPWFDDDFPLTPSEKAGHVITSLKTLMQVPTYKLLADEVGACVKVDADVYAAFQLPEHAADLKYLISRAALQDKSVVEPDGEWPDAAYAAIELGRVHGRKPVVVAFVTEEEEGTVGAEEVHRGN